MPFVTVFVIICFIW